MLIAAMGGILVSLFIFMGFAVGTFVDQESRDRDPRSADPQSSLVDPGTILGGFPRQWDTKARAFPLESLITLATPSADITEHSKFSAQMSEIPLEYHAHILRSRYRSACASDRSI